MSVSGRINQAGDEPTSNHLGLPCSHRVHVRFVGWCLSSVSLVPPTSLRQVHVLQCLADSSTNSEFLVKLFVGGVLWQPIVAGTV